MFTGIVESTGAIVSMEPAGADRRILIDGGALDCAGLKAGDSIAVNGVCLSAVAVDERRFAADVSIETLSCTTLDGLTAGSPVNLERALLPTARLGGHLVSGHVDGVGEIAAVEHHGRSLRLTISLPVRLARYVAAKGSICIDGVSLTVNTVDGADCGVNIIPHTLEHTVIGAYRRGSRVNVEVDIIARYLERLFSPAAEPRRTIDRAFLGEHGFINDV